jgi:cytokinin dehydrogenase
MGENGDYRLLRRRFGQALVSGTLVFGLNTLARALGVSADTLNSSDVASLSKLDGQLLTDSATINAHAQDYGQIVHKQPLAVLRPGSVRDIQRMVRFARRHGVRVAARGQGHQPFGQAQIQGGIVIDMSSLQAVRSVRADAIDVDGGAQWRSVLANALPYGVAPPVLTSYLGLTVGGTLSIGGIGVATFRRGAQIDHVLALDVVTGEGDLVTCSTSRQRDLFEAVLAGQGQCGVITRAVLRAEGVQPQLREYVLPYSDLESLLQAGERLRDERRFDGVVAIITPSPHGWTYLMTAVRQFTPPGIPNDADLLNDLGYVAGSERIRTVDFLEYADAMPNIDYAQSHADLGLHLPQSTAHTFIGDILPRLTAQDLGGAMLIRLFFLRANVFGQPLFRVPSESSFIYMALIRSETHDADALTRMLAGNRALYEQCREQGGTLYPFAAVAMTRRDWERHYSEQLHALRNAKHRYDPANVFASGPAELFPGRGCGR